MRAVNRWAPISGALYVVVFVIAFAIAGSSPSNDESDAKIAEYLADSSNQTKNTIALVLALIAFVLLIGFYASLRERLDAAVGHRGGGAGSLAFGAGIASASLLIVAISAFVSPLIASDEIGRAVGADLYRVVQDVGFPIWASSVMASSFAIWATAAVARSTGFLPGWFAWLSIVIGVLCLFAAVFFPIFLNLLWILIASILLVTRPPQNA